VSYLLLCKDSLADTDSSDDMALSRETRRRGLDIKKAANSRDAKAALRY
jgi:hypothetical protein